MCFIFQLWTNGTYLLMSITFKFDRDLTTRNVYLCTYEPRKPPNGLTSSLWSVFSGSSDDSDGRWVNQGDSVAIRSDEMSQSTENSLDSSPSRWETLTYRENILYLKFQLVQLYLWFNFSFWLVSICLNEFFV